MRLLLFWLLLNFQTGDSLRTPTTQPDTRSRITVHSTVAEIKKAARKEMLSKYQRFTFQAEGADFITFRRIDQDLTTWDIDFYFQETPQGVVVVAEKIWVEKSGDGSESRRRMYDALGCHNDRRAGNYHCHRGPLAGRTFANRAEAERALQEQKAPAPKSKPKPKKPRAKKLGNYILDSLK